jgi:hypothetical protein
MGSWKQRWHTFTSFLICALVVILGSVLYPLVLIFFASVALLHPLARHPRCGAGGTGAPPRGEGTAG